MATRRKAAEEVADVPDETIDRLDEMSLAELNSLIDRAVAMRDSKIDAARQEFIDRTRAEAEQLGLGMEDLMPRQPAKREAGKRGPAPIKYRGPNAGEEWSGRGRPPTWLANLEAEGRSRDEFAVK